MLFPGLPTRARGHQRQRFLAVGGWDNTIRVLSLAGEPRRTIVQGGWRMPYALCCVAERLYLIEVDEYGWGGYGVDPEADTEEQREARMAGRRVFGLTPEGEVLHVCNSPWPLDEKVWWLGINYSACATSTASWWC